MAGTLGSVPLRALLVAAVLAIAPATAGARDGDQAELERGVASLGRLLSHPEPAVRDAAADGLRALGSAVEIAFPAILEALAAGEGPRASAQALIERLGPRAAGLVPELVSYGRSGNPGARELVVEILGTLTPCVRGAEGFLAETAATGVRGPRESAARALLIADPTRTAARDLLAAAVREGTIERDVRLAAALGRAGLDAELAVWIVRALDDEELANKRFAEESLLHLDASSATAVPALQNGLNSALAPVRTAAADALGRIGPGAKAADGALERMLAGTSATEWFAAARALARIQPSHGVTAGRVLGALGERELADVASALAEFEPEVAARELGSRFDRGDARTKLRVVELAVEQITRAAQQDDGSAASVAEMRAIIHGRALALAASALILRAGSAAEPEVRARAVAAAATLPGRDDDVARLVLAALADPDAAVRGAAIAASARPSLTPAALAPRLSGLPAGGDPAIVAGGAGALVKALGPELARGIGSAAAARFDADALIELCVLSSDFELAGFTLRDAEIVSLLEVASGPDEARARLAARALRRHDGPVSAAAATRLAQTLASGPAFVQVAAAELLDRRCATPGVAIDALVRALGGAPSVADAAAGALVSHGDAAARALAAVLTDPSSERRRRAITTLAAMKGRARAAVAALLACLGDADPELSRAAAHALFSILTDGEIEARLERLERRR